MKIQRYGWHRPLPMPATRFPLFTAPHMMELPSSVDLRPEMPPVYDQLSLGSCTCHGTSAICHYLEMKKGKANPFVPDRLGIYYCTRILEGTVHQDSGASVAHAVQALARWGFCNESLWPYDIHQFDVNPPHNVYGAMWHGRLIKYATINQSLNDLKAVLATGNLFTFGFTVYESFESDAVAKTGIMPLPQPREQVVGGHCVCCVGFSDENQWFIVRNSWSNQWGDKGYFYMPYSFLLDISYCDDFWTITEIP